MLLDSTTLDRVFSNAVETRQVAGVVALAGNAHGPTYHGTFGERVLDAGAAMTLDTMFHIASMTKAITATAAMQLVEQGKLTLDEPLGKFVPYLGRPQVLEGFEADGAPRLRPARGDITLRRLMTHTAGFSYEMWSADFDRYLKSIDRPGPRSGRLEGIEQPLLFDPGTRWEYGINMEWVGRVVEAVSGENLNDYFIRHIFTPLGMDDTSFTPTDAQAARGAGMCTRQPDGALTNPQPFRKPNFPEYYPGGQGLVSTGPDYLRFLASLLAGGSGILRPETVALMGQNHLGALSVQPMRSVRPELSRDFELFPGMNKKWGLSFLINPEPVSGGRSAGSLSWGGLFNTHYWIDPQKDIAAVLLTQILPFGDPAVLNLLDAFEYELYKALI
jgi:CubicO group peptidase (beta-lactamase class C family)